MALFLQVPGCAWWVAEPPQKSGSRRGAAASEVHDVSCQPVLRSGNQAFARSRFEDAIKMGHPTGGGKS